MAESSNELARKAVHIVFGLVALALRWLTTWQAAGLALAAFVFNWKLLPHLGGSVIAREKRGTDTGILLYPLAVLALVLVFSGRPELAAASWGIIAFGDGMATIAGKLVPITALRWNRQKSLGGFMAFWLFGSLAAWFLWRFVAVVAPPNLMVLTALATLAAAIAESLDLRVDDNLVVPLVTALSFVYLLQFDALSVFIPEKSDGFAFLANLVLAVVAYLGRSVNVSGMIGGAVLGTVLILFGGWELYLLLLVFFILGTATTKIGFQKKAERGLAQEEGGRRGFSHAWSNCGVASLLAIGSAFSTNRELLWIGAAAAFATAAADTVASEVGQLLGKRAFLPHTFRRVETGTEGAISFEGTVAGTIAASLVAALATLLFGLRFGVEQRVVSPLPVFAVITFAAVAGSYLESLAGSYNRRSGAGIPNGALNFFNTLLGALIAMFGLSALSSQLSG